MSDGKNGFSNFEEFDFKLIGKAIKKAREARGITREQLSEVIDYAPRHIQAVENDGQSMIHRQLDTILNTLIQLLHYAGCLFSVEELFEFC